MKKISTIFLALFVCATTWAAIMPATFTPNAFTEKGKTDNGGGTIKAIVNGDTLTSSKGYVSDKLIRIYKNGSFKISTTQPITEIRLYNSGKDDAPNADKITVSIRDNNYTYDGGKKIGTWTPNKSEDIKEVSFSSSAKISFDSIIVYAGTKDVDVKSLSLDRDTLRLNEGETQTLNVTVDPDTVDVKWISSDSSVVVVNKSGVVRAIYPGEAMIIAGAGDKKDTCVVIVSGSGEYVWFDKVNSDNINELRNGDHIIIATLGNVPMGQWTSGKGVPAMDKMLVTNETNTRCKELTDAIYVLQQCDDKWLLVDTYNRYLVLNSDNAGAAESVTNNSKLTIDFKNGVQLTSIASNGSLRYNSNEKYFSVYNGTCNDIAMFFRHDNAAGQLSVEPNQLNFANKRLKGAKATDTLEIDIQFENLDEMGVFPEIKNASSTSIEFSIVGSPASITEPGKLRVAYYALEEGEYTAQLNLQALTLNGQELNLNVPMYVHVLEEGKPLLPVSIAQAYDSLKSDVGVWGNSSIEVGTTELLLGDVVVTGHYGSYLFVKDSTKSLCVFDNKNLTHAEGVYYNNGDTLTGLRGVMSVDENAVEMLPMEDYMPSVRTGVKVAPDTIAAALDVTYSGGNVNRFMYAKGVQFAVDSTVSQVGPVLNFTLGNDQVQAVNKFGRTFTVTKQGYFDIQGYVWASGKTMQLIVDTVLEGKEFTQHVTGVSLDKTSLQMLIGSQFTLTPSVVPFDAKNKDVTWGTLNASIATITNGIVTAVAEGQTKVWVKTEDGNFTDTCVVTIVSHGQQVTWKQIQYVDSLKEGAQVLIGTPAKDYVMGLYDKNASKDNILGMSAVYSANRHEVTADDIYAYIVRRVDGQFALQGSDGKYLYLNNGNLNSSETLTDNAKWKVQVDDRTGVATIQTNVKSHSDQIYFNKGSKIMFNTYTSKNNDAADLCLYSDNAADWVEYIPQPKFAILCGSDTIRDSLSYGNVVYDDSYGTESDPYCSSKTLTFVSEDIDDSIYLRLKKGKDFKIGYDDVADTLKAKGKVTSSVQFSTKNKGSYVDTLFVTCSTFSYKIALKAKAITKQEEEEQQKPQLTLSTKSIYMNPNYEVNIYDTAYFTFSVKNLVKKSLFIDWKNTTGYSIPQNATGTTDIYAGKEMIKLTYGSSTKMDTITRVNDTVQIYVAAWTKGLYESALEFYVYDDKGENKVFSELVMLTINVTDSPATPTNLNEEMRYMAEPKKLLHDNQLLIYRYGKWYRINGQIVNK